LKRRRKDTELLVALMIVVLFIGVIIGMLVVYMADRKKPQSQQPTIKHETVKEVTNVYFPNRNLVTGEIPRNSYNSDGFKIDDGFMAYFNEDGEKISHLGIDVSYHQKSIDFEQLKTTPVEFMMVRCGYRGYTEGGLIQDEKFEEYAQACNDNDIALGVYFFTQAITEEEAIAEADYVINLISKYNISYPVAFDTEYVQDREARTNLAELTPEQLSRICIAFCERIREAGYYPIIYASENWMRRSLDLTLLTEYDFWAPQYLEKNDFLYDFTIWQYTEKGSIAGISEEVDLNVSMIDYASFVPAIMDAKLTGGEITTYDSQESENW